MDSILTTIIRTCIGFVVLLFLTRVLGKKQLSQMTFFTYITGIALGNIAGDMVVHSDIKLHTGILGLALWALLTFGIETLSLKSSKARVLLDGEPTILIKEGKVLEKAMASNRLNMDDLSMLLRTKNIFSLRDVDYAILEPNGQISVLKQVAQESVTKQDLQLPTPKRQYLPTELIVDGQVVQRNLQELGLNRSWLSVQLKQQGIDSYEDIFYAELQSDGSIWIDKKSDVTS
ncbi:MAG TPA: DUF421 domain-containing protein [Bacilli bacterium]|nr:DUF421 domain-containing protein [Bacilli bacterium]